MAYKTVQDIKRALDDAQDNHERRFAEELDLYDRYTGREYPAGHALYKIDGKSQFLTREVFEQVEWAKPKLIRLFASGNLPVSCVLDNDNQNLAHTRTLEIHKALRRSPEYFSAIRDIITNALLTPISFAYIRQVEPDSHEERVQWPIEQLQPFLDQGLVVAAQEIQPGIYDALIRIIGGPVIEIESCRGVDVWLDPTWHSSRLSDASYCAWRKIYTRENLEHWDLVTTKQLNDARARSVLADEGIERQIRQWSIYGTSDQFFGTDDYYEYLEFFSQAKNGKWIWTQLLGEIILNQREIDYLPIVAWTCTRLPGYRDGIPLAAQVTDQQEISTTLIREALDSVYRASAAKTWYDRALISHTGETESAIRSPDARYVPAEGPPQGGVWQEERQSMIGEVFPMIEQVASMLMKRTGVAPENDLSPEVMKNAPMGTYLTSRKAGGVRLELVARELAETGFCEVIRVIQHMLHADQQKYRVVVDTGFGVIDPSDESRKYLDVLAMQKEAMQVGLSNVKKIYHTLSKIVETSDLGDPKNFFIEPDENNPEYKPPEPPPPMSPAEEEYLRIEKAKVRSSHRTKMRELGIREQDLTDKSNLADFKFLAEQLTSQLDGTLKLMQASKLVSETRPEHVEAAMDVADTVVDKYEDAQDQMMQTMAEQGRPDPVEPPLTDQPSVEELAGPGIPEPEAPPLPPVIPPGEEPEGGF